MGMVAATLPVQWLLPLLGWRALFGLLAALLLLAMGVLAWRVPRWEPVSAGVEQGSYAEVWRHPYFRRLAPLGFFNYGGMVAIQTLWVVPWMMRVAGSDASGAAAALFGINVAMLLSFGSWGLLMPRLARHGVQAEQLMRWGTPLSLLALALIVVFGEQAGAQAAWLWGLFCVSSTFLSLAQPAVGLAFEAGQAGRALSAYNLVIFSGVFAVQWGIGLGIDALTGVGASTGQAFRGALAVLLLCNGGAYLYYLQGGHNRGRT